MTPELAARYARRMLDEGVACLEVSAGSTYWAPFVMCRGEVPAKEMGRVAPWPLSVMVARTLRRSPAPAFVEAYNLPGAQRIRREVPDLPLAVVGGMRSGPTRRSVCPPARRTSSHSRVPWCGARPGARFREGRATVSSCISCTRCLAGSYNGLPWPATCAACPRKSEHRKRSAKRRPSSWHCFAARASSIRKCPRFRPGLEGEKSAVLQAYICR